MSLKPVLSVQSQSQDATICFLTDSTGLYSTSNVGGYGAPNQLRSNIVSATIAITLPGSPLLYPTAPSSYDGSTNTTYNSGTVYPPTGVAPSTAPITITLNGASSPSAVSFANGTVPLLLNAANLGLNTNAQLPNGVYGYVYTLTFLDTTVSVTTGNFFLIGAAQVCQYSKIGALSLITPGECYDNESATSLANLGLVIQAAVNAYSCGDLSTAQQMAQWLDIRCNTITPGSVVTNYGQASSGLSGCGCS